MYEDVVIIVCAFVFLGATITSFILSTISGIYLTDNTVDTISSAKSANIGMIVIDVITLIIIMVLSILWIIIQYYIGE